MSWNSALLWKGLKDFLLCNLYRLKGKLTYPDSILPKRTYIHIMDIASLCAIGDIYALRRSEKPVGDNFHVIGEFRILREAAIEPLEVPNMSVNLMGGLFQEEHIKFVP